MGTSWNTLFGTELHCDDHYVCSVAVFLDDHYAILCVAQGSQPAVGASHIPSTQFVTFRQHRLWIIAMRMIPGRNHATGHGGRAYGQYLHVQASINRIECCVRSLNCLTQHMYAVLEP